MLSPFYQKMKDALPEEKEGLIKEAFGGLLDDYDSLEEGLYNEMDEFDEYGDYLEYSDNKLEPVAKLSSKEDALVLRNTLEEVACKLDGSTPYYLSLSDISSSDDEEDAEESLHGWDEIEEFSRLCDQIGLKTLGDLQDFLKREGKGKEPLEALRHYLEYELGLDFYPVNESISLTDKILAEANEAQGDVDNERDVAIKKLLEAAKSDPEVGAAIHDILLILKDKTGESKEEPANENQEDLYGFEAMGSDLIDSFRTALTSSISKEGALTTIQKMMDFGDLEGEFNEELYFIKNAFDLTDTQEVINSIMSSAETVLPDYKLEELIGILSPETTEQEMDDYEEPENWDDVDQAEVEEPEKEKEIPDDVQATLDEVENQ